MKNKIIRWWESFKQSAQQFAIVQLFLTLVSLPILIAWGLPISLLSPIGNFVFNPFLTIFLLLSTLIFFSEIIGIPNGVFIYCLEKTRIIWQYCLGFSSKSAMYAFKEPPWIILCAIPIISMLAIHHPLLRQPRHKLIGLTLISFITWSILSFYPNPTPSIISIPCNNKKITLLNHNNKIILLDPGVIGRRISAPSWVSYTLTSEIAKQLGTTSLDTVICTKLGKIQFDALYSLLSKITVHTLYLPRFEGTLTPHTKRAFNRMYAVAKQNNTTIKYLYDTPRHIHNGDLKIVCEPDKKQKYQTITYTQHTITAAIDNQPIDV